MKYLKIILIIGIVSVTLEAEQLNKNRCFSYNSKEFTLTQLIYKGDKEIHKNLKLDKVKIYYFKDSSPTKPITLEYSINGHTRYYKYIFCTNEKNQTKWCGIECDGGGFHLKKDFSIYVEYPLRVAGESPDDPDVPIIELAQTSKKYLKGTEFKCPIKLPKVADNIDDKFYKDNPNGKNVCYDYKYKDKYFGCFRSTKSCRDLHRQHFGKYGTKEATKKALNRCKNSKPNSKYSDNPKGLYVCYDYKDEGIYSGCFRSIESCKSKGKQHFGKYPNIIESRNAFRRCITSMPR